MCFALWSLAGLFLFVIIELDWKNENRKIVYTALNSFQINRGNSNEHEKYQVELDNDVIFLIMTGKPHQDRRVSLQQQTWMQYTAKTFIFSETASTLLPLIVLPNISDSYATAGPKFWDALQWAWKKFGHKTKWFVKIDDDTFVNVQEVWKLLKRKDATKLRVVGRCAVFSPPKSDIPKGGLPNEWTFVDGGAGMFINSYTMQLLNAYGFLNKSNVLQRHGEKLFEVQDTVFGEILTEIAHREAYRHKINFTSPFDCENERLQHACNPNHFETTHCLKLPCVTLHRCREQLMLYWHEQFHSNIPSPQSSTGENK
ncbi:unnamed protein product [Rotaria socialis]|uniref:N-acetylgalactosaminide beta-1,3-galactosyltransferase n=1 Tax=Rotaria socialis TaxID=392032 RepID=A0A821MVP9_9BILA|nr:unnamed protein product [Rotaria socialis]CAF4775744.1 unnamed protein product [Rotaria socialis]